MPPSLPAGPYPAPQPTRVRLAKAPRAGRLYTLQTMPLDGGGTFVQNIALRLPRRLGTLAMTPQQCRARAENCMALAAETPDPAEKTKLLDMAAHWLELARATLETGERQTAPSSGRDRQ